MKKTVVVHRNSPIAANGPKSGQVKLRIRRVVGGYNVRRDGLKFICSWSGHENKSGKRGLHMTECDLIVTVLVAIFVSGSCRGNASPTDFSAPL